jgi:hypothetical protein
MSPLRKIMLLLFMLPLLSMAAHKYYVAVFQLEYVPAKRVVQVTSRIFIDDLEAALQKKHGRKFYLGTSAEVKDADAVLKQYFSEKIHVKINGKDQSVIFLGKETEDDVLVCYSKITADAPVKSIQVHNTVLFEIYEEQQNIIHTKVSSNKKSLLLTNDKPEGELKF